VGEAAGSGRLPPPEGDADGARFELEGRAAGSLGASRSDGRPASGALEPDGARAAPRSAAGARPTEGAARSLFGARAGAARPELRGAATAPCPVLTRSEGRASGAAARTGVDAGGNRFTAGLDDGRLTAAGSDARAGAVAGAATAVVAGLRVAVRRVAPRGSSLYPLPPNAKGEGRTTATPRRPPAAYTVRARPP
jgi:hypothetical protein